MTTSAAPTVTVLCADHRPSGMASVEQHADVRYVTADELSDGLRGAEVLFLWDFFSDALREAWPAASDLRWVHVAAAGVDSLLFPELVDSAVVVTNSGGVFERPIAEYVLATVLAYAKDLRTTWSLQDQRHWQHRETERIEGARVLVVGTGPIGREIARLLSRVGMDVAGVGRVAREHDPDFGSVHASSALRDVVGGADYVVVAAPLTEATRGLVDRPVLRAMKPSARLINVARGQIVDQRAVTDALGDGEIAGAALDVFADEPLPPDDPLWQAPGALISPHMSGDVAGWLDALAELFVRNFHRWQHGEALPNVVDKHRGYVPTQSPAPSMAEQG